MNDDRRPLALPAEDDRGPSYTAAVERSEAAFEHVRQALGHGRAPVNTAAELARVAAALPPEVSILLDPVRWLPPGTEPGEDWTPSVVATLAALAEQPATPVRDQAGREHDVPVPGVELSTWLLPPGSDTPPPGPGRAYGRYDRLIEALGQDGPGDVLRAASALLSHVASLLAGDDGPAGFLSSGSRVAAVIDHQCGQLAELAADMAGLAPLADAAEAADAAGDPPAAED